MNSILAIVFACGVGAACGHDYFPAEAHDVTASDVNAQTRAMDNYFWRNERLVAAIEIFQDILSSRSSGFLTSANTYTREDVILLAFYFLQYFDKETGSFDSDLEEAHATTLQLPLTPIWMDIVTARLQTQLAKFVSAVANRIGHVQDLCKNNKECSLDILQRDSAERLLCPSYYHHAYLHNVALKRISRIEAFTNTFFDNTQQQSQLTRIRRNTESLSSSNYSMPKSVLNEFEKDLLQFKSVFRVLKSRDYSCLNIDSVYDYVEQSCQPSCLN